MFDVIQGEMTTVGLVLGGLVFIAILARRLQPLLAQRGGSKGALKHLGTLALTPQCSVSLVQVGKETLVLGLTPQNVSLLAKANALDGQESYESRQAAAIKPAESAAGNFSPFVAERE